MNNTKSQYKIYKIYNLIIVIGVTAIFGFSNRLSPLYYSDFMCLFILFGSFLIWFLEGFIWKKSLFDCENCLLILMIVTGIVKASYFFKQSWYYTLKEAMFPITTIFSYYMMSAVYNNERKVESFKKAIVLGSSISSVVSIVASLFLRVGIDLLATGEFLKERNGLPRFSYGRTLVIIGFFISFVELKYGRKYKKRYLINIILNAINILFIMQSRTLILYMFLSVVATLVVFSEYKKTKFTILIMGLVVFWVLLLNVSDFLALHTNYYNNDPGIRVRFEAIVQYWEYFKENLFCGVGFLTTSDNSSLNVILGGKRGQYNTSDVGIFGFIVQHGIIGVVWLILWFKKIISIYVRNQSNVDLRQSAVVLILIIFYLLTLINLMFTANPMFLDRSILMLLTQSLIFCKRKSPELAS